MQWVKFQTVTLFAGDEKVRSIRSNHGQSRRLGQFRAPQVGNLFHSCSSIFLWSKTKTNLSLSLRDHVKTHRNLRQLSFAFLGLLITWASVACINSKYRILVYVMSRLMGLACNRNNVDPCLAIRKIPCCHCSFVVHLIGIPELDFRERNT